MLKVEVRKARNGQGLFATKKFQAGEQIMPIKGRRFHYKTLLKIGGTFLDNSFRLSPEYYLNPQGQLGDYLNHSCQPNSRVEKIGNGLYLFALKPIRSGQEILLDYSTILAADDTWTMRCNCGTESCRKLVKKYSSLPGGLKASYLQNKIIPNYIVKI